jgi:DNA-binding MarR family transcriptional regulator
MDWDTLEIIEHEVVMLLRRADFKKTLDGRKGSLERSAYLILKRIDQDGPLAMNLLAQLFQLDLSTVSRQVLSLETKGFVSRSIDPLDARVKVVKLTALGKSALEKTKQKRKELYDQLLLDWSDDEKDVFAELLSKLNRAMEHHKTLR